MNLGMMIPSIFLGFIKNTALFHLQYIFNPYIDEEEPMKCRALRCGRYCEVLSPSEFRQLWQDEIAALAELAAQPGST
jgi:hypothetical protein